MINFLLSEKVVNYFEVFVSALDKIVNTMNICFTMQVTKFNHEIMQILGGYKDSLAFKPFKPLHSKILRKFLSVSITSHDT